MRRPSPLPEPPRRPTTPAAVSPRARSASPAQQSEDERATTPIETPWWRRVAPVGRREEREPAEQAEPERPDNLTVIHAADEPAEIAAADIAPEPAHDGRLSSAWRASRAKRRALRSEMRRFTARARRRRLVTFAWLGAVIALVAGSFAVAYSPLFAVDRITVTGTSGLAPETVVAALQSQVGRPLAQVDEAQIRTALAAFPLIETFNVQARPPHELVVQIAERTPVGLVSTEAGFDLVDGAGVVLSSSADAPAGYPVIEVVAGSDSAAFRAVGTVLRSLPETIRPLVTSASAGTPNSVVLTLGATGTEVLWGGAGESAEKALVLAAAMQSRPPEHTSRYDVSSPDAIIMR